jgi:hypothetical protein
MYHKSLPQQMNGEYPNVVSVIELGEQSSISDYFTNAMPFVPEVFKEYVNDATGWKFLPYQHLQYFRCKYQGGEEIFLWSCIYCTFWCEVFDTDIMNLHLCRRCTKIPSAEREELRKINYERLKMQLCDIYDVALNITPMVSSLNVVE